MDQPVLRKPKLYFDSRASPSHVTFAEGGRRRNLPWTLFVEATWDDEEADLIKMEIGDWIVLIHGHNLGPLFEAIEEPTLIRLGARPDLKGDRAHEPDTFAYAIQFLKAPPRSREKKPPAQIEIAPGDAAPSGST